MSWYNWTPMRVAAPRRALLCLLLLPCLGFDWPGRVYRIDHELRHAEPEQRRDLVRELAQYPAAQVRETLLRALEDDDDGVRLEAAAVAGRVRLREAVPILLDWIDDKEADRRRAAAAALGQLGEARALPALVRALGDGSADVRREAVLALGRLGGADSVTPLLGRLEDVDLSVRIDAMNAVAALHDGRAVVPLLGQAADSSPEVRAAALRALGELGDARALPALTRALGDEVDDVRIAAAAALGRIGDRAAVRAFKPALERDDPRLGKTIVAALGAIDNDEAREQLIAELERPALRRAAVLALVRQAARLAHAPAPAAAGSGNAPSQAAGASAKASPSSSQPPAAPIDTFVLAIAAEARSADAGTRLAAAEALSRMSELATIRAAVDPLLSALGTADDATAPALMRALAASGAPEALMPLLERLGQAERDAITPVLDALALYFEHTEPDGRAADPLLGKLTGADPAQRVALVQLLGRVGAQRALPALLPWLASDDAPLRLATIRALGAIGASAAAPALLPLLDTEDAATRFEAARALRTTADVPALRALFARLAGNDSADRHALLVAVGGALGRLQRDKQVPSDLGEQARKSLAALARGQDPELADRALDALAVWAPPDAVDIIAQSLRAPSSERRAAAVAALSQLDAPGARELLRYELQQGRGREAAAAAVGLAEIGDQRDMAALVRSTKRLHWPVPGAAAYALSRMAARGALKPHTAMRALCELGRSREPYVRANVAAAMAALGAAPCDAGGPDPLHWLSSAHAAVVRGGAARWLQAAVAAGHVDAAGARAALERCAQSDVESTVRDTCTIARQPRGNEATDVYAYARDGVTLLRDTLVAVRLADGSVYLGYTDRNGHLRLRAAPRGPLVLEDPGLMPLEPTEDTAPADADRP